MLQIVEIRAKFLCKILFVLFAGIAHANLESAPEAPLHHCYHWIKEEDSKFLSFKYEHAEKTGGEFTFFTSNSGHAAGEGIYCSKTLLGSYSYGDRVVRLDFSQDTVFRTESNTNVCNKEAFVTDCASREPDVISYNTGRGWYVIKKPEVILSWSSNSDELRNDFKAESRYERHSHLQNALAAMDAELTRRPKVTYFNPKARKGILKLLENDSNVARLASEPLVGRILTFSDEELIPDRKKTLIALIIQELANQNKLRDLARLHSQIAVFPDVQDRVSSLLREQLTPDFKAGLDLVAMLEFDSVVPDKFDASAVQAVFFNSLKTAQNLDEFLKAVEKSEKTRPFISTIEFDEKRAGQLRNKSSIVIALKNTVAQGNLPTKANVIRILMTSMSKHFTQSEIPEILADSRLLATSNLKFLWNYFFENGRFRDFSGPLFSDILSRTYSVSDPEIFVSTLAATLETLPNWLAAFDILQSQSFLSPHIPRLLPSSTDSLTKLEKSYDWITDLLRFEEALLARPKLSAKEMAYVKTALPLLVSYHMCVNPLALDLKNLEKFKVYPTLFKEALTLLLNKKESGLLASDCSIVAFASALSGIEKKVPVDVSKKLWARFDAMKIPKENSFELDLNTKYWPLDSVVEWKVFEKILDQAISNCKIANAPCDIERAIDKYMLRYFRARYMGEEENKTRSTSRFIARITDYFIKKGYPALGWVSLQWESYFYDLPSKRQHPMVNYLDLYSAKTVNPEFKKRFEILIDHSFDINFWDYVLSISNPNYKFKEAQELRVKSSVAIVNRVIDNAYKRKFEYFTSSPQYQVSLNSRDQAQYRSNNFFCRFVTSGLKRNSTYLAKEIKRGEEDFVKQLDLIFEKFCVNE